MKKVSISLHYLDIVTKTYNKKKFSTTDYSYVFMLLFVKLYRSFAYLKGWFMLPRTL